MKQYFCDCLNVTINVREGREVCGTTLVSFQADQENKDQLFSKTLLDVNLGISGIEVVSL